MKAKRMMKCNVAAVLLAVCVFHIAVTSSMAEGTIAVREGEVLELKEHPRLWVTEDVVVNLKDKLHTPYLQSSAERIIADAEWLLDLEPIQQDEGRSNQHGTRAVGSHLGTLTAAYILTKDPKYRAAAMKHLKNILNWRHISCEANINTPLENKMFFCLSYGEHAALIAQMYDVFRPDITEEEMQVFNDVLDRFYLSQALRAYERHPWWVNKAWSNWNGVCAGGMGMLALAFYDDRPEARKLIPFVEESLSHYFKSYIENGGGNHEGTGYWNYGMHYAIRYLLSYEQATGKKHPAFDIPELAKSLHFPVDFTGITFGDNDGWHPTGMFFLMADRTNQPEAAMRAAAYLMKEVGPAPDNRPRVSRTHGGDILFGASHIPTDEYMNKLKAERAVEKQPLARVYEGLGWAVLADDSAFPTLRLSARGGSSKITGHGHIDLLSFKCMVNGVRMIEDQKGWQPGVAFTGRGQDLYSRSAAAKSTLFVDGLGCAENVTCPVTEVVEGDGIIGIRIDATRVYLRRWRGFIGRLFLLVDGQYWLVVDTAPGHQMESRFHTFADYELTENAASLKKQGQDMTMTFASLSPSVIQEAIGTPESVATPAKIIRYMNKSGSRDSLNVTALNPGDQKLNLELSTDEQGYVIKVTGGDREPRTIRLSRKLELLD